MPIYEYHCSKCGDFEAMRKISDAPLTHCPTCRRKVTKLISSTSFQLKGSGWYVTDYARKSGDAAKSTKKAEKKGDDKASTSTAAGESGSGTTSDGSSEKKSGGEKAAVA